MRTVLKALAVLVLLAGAFLLGRWSGETSGKDTSQDRVDATRTADVSQEPARAAAAAPDGSVPRLHPRTEPTTSGTMPLAGPPSAALLHSVPISATATGPKPLEAEDERALASAERIMAADGGTGRDLLDLANKEAQDAQARQLESLISQSILQHGGRYEELRMSAPHCTRSVCIVRAVGTGTTQNQRSDWQMLNSEIVNEPWFREAFDDVRGMVGGDGPNTVYVTLYVRCEPGTCRMGRR